MKTVHNLVTEYNAVYSTIIKEENEIYQRGKGVKLKKYKMCKDKDIINSEN